MRLSLRTLVIAVAVVPLAIGLVAWEFWPQRGSPKTIREFTQALKSGSRSRIETATYHCFAEGLPATRYQSLLNGAYKVHGGSQFIDTPKTATVYEFASGGSPIEGRSGVFVAVDGTPPVIVSATVSTYLD